MSNRHSRLPIPNLGCDAVSALVFLVVMGKMIGLHFTKVDLENLGMVEVVVGHVIEDVSKECASHDCIGL